jgi:hypothetical protein
MITDTGTHQTVATALNSNCNPAVEGVAEFSTAVDDCYARYAGNGLPGRASEIYQCLARWKSANPGI